MNGIIFDIKRFAVHDGPGIRTTVFMKGCPLNCWWCHNPESINKAPVCVPKTVKLNGRTYTNEETVGYETSSEELLQEICKEQIFMEESGGGVTFSGGEPLLQHRFLLEMLKLCKERNIQTAVDTTVFSGWKIADSIAGIADLLLIDLKLMDEDSHKKYTGVSNRSILENIRKLSEARRRIRIRIPVIPGINDTSDNIGKSIDFLKELNSPVEAIDLLPYHDIAKHKYDRFRLPNRLAGKPSISKEDLSGLQKRFEAAGFTVKIGG